MNQEIEPADEPLTFHEDDIGFDANKPDAAANPLPLPRPLPVIEKPARKLANRKLVTTLTLTSRTCKWPIGDPARSGFHYCGRLPQSGRPYCETHDRMSYQSTPRRRPS